ncbi:MAG: LpqN/LpqT family lipoprotein [Mycobacterium sp.]
MLAGHQRLLSALCVVLAVGAGGVGCSKEKSDTKAEEGKSSQSQTSKAPGSTQASVTAAPGLKPTLDDYIKQDNITQENLKPGVEGAPDIKIPTVPGWGDAGAKTPEYAYGALFATDPAYGMDPPRMVIVLSKLTGEVDKAKVLQYAPNEVFNLPQFSGGNAGRPVNLAGFDAVEAGGTFVRNGQTRVIAQKSVVIPGKDALYVLTFNAEAPKDLAGVLSKETTAIDAEVKITAPQ